MISFPRGLGHLQGGLARQHPGLLLIKHATRGLHHRPDAVLLGGHPRVVEGGQHVEREEEQEQAQREPGEGEHLAGEETEPGQGRLLLGGPLRWHRNGSIDSALQDDEAS
jgi:hypothetical protein